MKSLLVIICSLVVLNVWAQETETNTKGYKKGNNIDLTVGIGGAQNMGALSWTHNHGIGAKKKFKIGYGLRLTSQFGNKLSYTTAPAKLTSGITGPVAMFSENIPANIDTIVVASTQFNALNAFINLQYTFKNKLDLGFNIDVIGFSFGKKVSASYYSSKVPSIALAQEAKPTSLNALLISDNDIGTVNSELYVRYWFNGKWAVKGGVSFLFTEYTTSNKLRLNNDRFRNKVLLGVIGVSYNPFK